MKEEIIRAIIDLLNTIDDEELLSFIRTYITDLLEE